MHFFPTSKHFLLLSGEERILKIQQVNRFLGFTHESCPRALKARLRSTQVMHVEMEAEALSAVKTSKVGMKHNTFYGLKEGKQTISSWFLLFLMPIVRVGQEIQEVRKG